MARTMHTIPRRIRAPRRVEAPDAPRGEGDPSPRRHQLRILREQGVYAEPAAAPGASPDALPLPRVRVSPPRPGHLHPAGKNEILDLLRFFGAECTYGLRSVELVQGPPQDPAKPIPLAALSVPGRILLFDQHQPPWTLNGHLPEDEEARLRGAGAQVRRVGPQTVVAWPGRTLRDFLLFEGLLHEVGHHMVQQYTGKRPARVLRTKDHEARAAAFVRRCRLRYLESPHPDA
jgi:hypothetical protein